MEKGELQTARKTYQIKVQTNPLLSQQVLHTIPGYLSAKPSCLSPTGCALPPSKQEILPIPTCQAVCAPHAGDPSKPPVPAGEAQQYLSAHSGDVAPIKEEVPEAFRPCLNHLQSDLKACSAPGLY